MRILVLRGGALGDFLVTLPALGLLRARWPDARIELVGNARVAELGVLGGYLDAVHSQDQARWSALFSAAAAELPPALAAWLAEFELVLNYWPDPDQTLGRRFPARPCQEYLSASAQPELAPAARHFCEPLRALGLSTVDYCSRLRTPDDASCHREAGEASRGDPALRQAPGPELRRGTGLLRRIASRNDNRPGSPASLPKLGLIAVHPGSGSPRKNWPLPRWIELINRLDWPILLVLGEAEQEWLPICRSLLARAAAAGLAGDDRRRKPSARRQSGRSSVASDLPTSKDIQLAQNLPLPELAAALARCRLFIGHDSGVSHLAAAVGTPCVVLFGPTDPAMWAPPGDHVRVLRRGPDLNSLGVDEVLRALPAEP